MTFPDEGVALNFLLEENLDDAIPFAAFLSAV
jgi:hypothetical protein